MLARRQRSDKAEIIGSLMVARAAFEGRPLSIFLGSELSSPLAAGAGARAQPTSPSSATAALARRWWHHTDLHPRLEPQLEREVVLVAPDGLAQRLVVPPVRKVERLAPAVLVERRRQVVVYLFTCHTAGGGRQEVSALRPTEHEAARPNTTRAVHLLRHAKQPPAATEAPLNPAGSTACARLADLIGSAPPTSPRSARAPRGQRRRQQPRGQWLQSGCGAHYPTRTRTPTAATGRPRAPRARTLPRLPRTAPSVGRAAAYAPRRGAARARTAA